VDLCIRSLKEKRNSYDIMDNILKDCKTKKIITNIMSDIGISYPSAKKYLGLLLDFGLVEKIAHKYVASNKGEHFLEVYIELNKLLETKKAVT